MKSVLALVASLGLLIGSIAQASEDWRHVGPLNSGNISVLIDFQSNSARSNDPWYPNEPQGPSSYTESAGPVWINVHRQGLTDQDRVRVLVINYGTDIYRGQTMKSYEESTREIDLSYAENGRFTGMFESLTIYKQHNDGYAMSVTKHRQEIVVWINNEIFKDNSTGSNIGFDMSQARRD